MTPAHRQQLWSRIITQVTEEFAALPAAERHWLEQQLQLVADLQLRIHTLFAQAAGEEHCRNCRGECCGHGSFHFNLANLLGYLVRDVPLLMPDFTASCPYLGTGGCRIPPELRPFNCVTFICDVIDERLNAGQREDFYRLERQLRLAYLEFQEHFQGSSLRGLLQDGARLNGKAFLQHP
jgi:hypothetical protein